MSEHKLIVEAVEDLRQDTFDKLMKSRDPHMEHSLKKKLAALDKLLDKWEGLNNMVRNKPLRIPDPLDPSEPTVEEAP